MINKFVLIICCFLSVQVKAQISSACNTLNFDGVDDYIDLNSIASSLVGSTNYTVEFWMKADRFNQPSPITAVSLFAINSNAPIASDGILITMGSPSSQTGQLGISDEGGAWDWIGGANIGDNVCHHIAYVRNGNTGFIYLDGVNVGNHFTNYLITVNDSISVGQDWDYLATSPATSQFYNGNIDDLRIWTTSRSQVQIVTNMNIELIGNELGLLAYYDFNQGVSGGNNGGNNTLIDKTINGLNGNLIDFGLNGFGSNWIENSCANPICDSSYQCKLTSNFSVDSLCFGDSTSFTDLSIDSNANIVNWQWYFGDGDSIIGIQNPNHLYGSIGSFNVILAVTNDSNCIDSIMIPLTINPVYNLTITDSICQGDSIFLGGTFQNSVGIYVDSLQSFFGCDSIITTTLAVNPIFSSTQNQTICQGDSVLFGGTFYNSTGIYTDSLQTILGCDSLEVLDLTVNPSYQINVNETICQGDSLLIGGSYQTVTGFFSDTLQTVLLCDSIINTTLIVESNYYDTTTLRLCQGDSILLGGVFQNSPGIYTDSLQSVYGCDSVVIVTLSIDSIPIIIASNDTLIQVCRSTQLSAVGGTSYSWLPLTDLSCSNCSSPVVSPLTTITYIVTGTVNGCSAKDTVVITVEGESEIIIPNVFTPNFDGLNDGFNITGGCIQSINKKIFNRWGELLFQSNQISEVWNGRTITGDKVPEGTYFYVFDIEMFVDGELTFKVFKGSVSLLR